MPLGVVYGVRVRDTSGGPGGTWATYVRAARTEAHLSQSALGRMIGKDRSTIMRWENHGSRPEDASVVQRLAQVLELDLDEALSAAGLRPVDNAPRRPARPADPEIERILRSTRLSQQRKQFLIAHIRARREAEERSRLADLDVMIRGFEREE
jgi:transcriptional regulator with XRE-family HTH domain